MALIDSDQSPGRIVVFGGGDHGVVVAEAAGLAGFDVVGFVDERIPAGTMVADRPVLEAIPEGARVIVAIGDNAGRSEAVERLAIDDRRLATVVHPTAFISPSAALEPGVFIGPRAVVHAAARVGRGAIVNTAAVVEHHNDIAPFAHLAPGAALAGRVRVGGRALVGVGAAVRPGVAIGADAVVGAGAVVVDNVPEAAVVMGNPARRRD